MKLTLLLFTLLIATLTGAEGAEPVVWAHLEGTSNFMQVDTNIVVSAQEKTVFHAHADFDDGGGVWYNASISLEDTTVTILERDSVTKPRKDGSKVETKESIYRLSILKITGEPIRLKNGSRITLKVGNKNPASALSVTTPEPIDIVRIEAGGEITLNGITVDIEQLSRKFKRSSVIISADKSVPYKSVTAVLAETEKAGVKNVSFVTKETSKPSTD